MSCCGVEDKVRGINSPSFDDHPADEYAVQPHPWPCIPTPLAINSTLTDASHVDELSIARPGQASSQDVFVAPGTHNLLPTAQPSVRQRQCRRPLQYCILSCRCWECSLLGLFMAPWLFGSIESGFVASLLLQSICYPNTREHWTWLLKSGLFLLCICLKCKPRYHQTEEPQCVGCMSHACLILCSTFITTRRESSESEEDQLHSE